MPRHYSEGKLDMTILRDTAEKCKNWGRWGPDDEAGTLNFITPQDIVAAAALIRKGKVFSLGLNFDKDGPQRALWGNRFNPIHTMLATGTDAVAGKQDEGRFRYADDMVSLPLQCGTQWDALGHIFFDDKMWNGYDARLVDSNGAQKNGIEKVKDRMTGRGVLLDVAKYAKVEALDEGIAITKADLDETAAAQGVEVRRGDFVIVRTGMLGQRQRDKDWGDYAGGDAPGLAFETAEWIYAKEIAAICCDTWGCEVRPNETTEAQQPWHWVVIPMIGITMGEIFVVDQLADDCAADGVYEFFFCAPPLPVTGGVGSPLNPIAIK
ncbi:MAG: cyclase family protein [Gammaproteobacteria bacterium]|nr:cyclase family protein [Gammaproteobacteria bacterium]MCZ6498352.1 cyclase family protein [Gammaproteobacteria bacterium]